MTNETTFEKINSIGNIQGDVYAIEPLKDGGLLAEYDVRTSHFNTNLHSWIKHGEYDTTPNILRNLYRKSSMHKSAINVKTNITAGGEFDYIPLEQYYEKNEFGEFEYKEQKLSDAEKKALIIQAKLFAKNLGLNSFFKKAASQIHLYGGYYSFRDYGLNRHADFSLKSLYIPSFLTCRIGSRRTFIDGEFKSNRHYVSNDFTRVNPDRAKPYRVSTDIERTQKIDRYNLYYIGIDDGSVIPNEVPGLYSKLVGIENDYRNYYHTPDYESLDTLNYIDVDYMLSQHDLNEIKNGFALNTILVRYRSKKPTKAAEKLERKKEKEFIKKNFKGADGERTMITWVEPHMDDSGKVQTPETWKVIEIPHNNTPERYNILREERLVKILNAHQIVTGEIIGLPRLNKLGFSSQSEFLIHAQEQMYFNVNKPIQELICKDIDELLIASGIPVKIRPKKHLANFKVLTDKLLMWAYGKDEVRTKFGDEQMSEEVASEVMSRIQKQEKEKEDV